MKELYSEECLRLIECSDVTLSPKGQCRNRRLSTWFSPLI